MKYFLLIAAVVAFLTGCENTTNSDGIPNGIEPKLVVAAVAPDYGTSDVVIIGDTAFEDNVVAEGLIATTEITDIAVAVHDGDVYRIGRFGIDNVTRFSWNVFSSSVSTDWQYSVQGDDASANPYAMAFASTSKAYVARFASNHLWVVNPLAETEEDFYTTSIDLTAYANSSDDTPNASDVIIVGNKLFVLLQDLDGFTPVVDSSVVVIDTTDEDVITTIDLDVRNAQSMMLANDGLIYIDAVGDAYADLFGNTRPISGKYTGGIVSIDPTNYDRQLVLDDGNELDAPYNSITNVAVADNHDVFFSGSDFAGNDKLYVLELGNTVATEISLGNNLYNITDLAERDGSIYVGVQAQTDGSESAGLKVVNTTTQQVTDFIETVFNPTQIAVVE